MKNKKILLTLLIIFFILILNPNNSFAITNIFVKNQFNENVSLSLPDSLDSFKYIVVIDIGKNNSSTYRVYWSDESFSISDVEGSSYYFYSENGAFWSPYNSSSMTGQFEKQHTSYHGENNFTHKIIFSTFNLINHEGTVIYPANEYLTDFTNTNNPAEFYEQNSSGTVVQPDNSDTVVDTDGTKDSMNNSVNEILNKFAFVNNIKENTSGLIDFIVNIKPCPTLTLDVNSKWYSGELKVIDLSFYEPYKEVGDLIIVAFAYLLFLWHMFIKLPDTISGIGSSVSFYNSSSKGVNK